MVEEETATHEKQLEDFDAKKASHEGRNVMDYFSLTIFRVQEWYVIV